MLIPSIDLMGGRIVQLVHGEKLKVAFDDFDYWIQRFAKYPLVQLIDLDVAMRQGETFGFIGVTNKLDFWRNDFGIGICLVPLKKLQ